MTGEQIKQWKESRDIARAIADPESRRVALEKVYDQRDDLQMECIQHQADRIKKCLAKTEMMELDVGHIKNELGVVKDEMGPLKSTCEEYKLMKERGRGAIWGVRLAIAIAGVVGFETLKGLFNALHGAMTVQ